MIVKPEQDGKFKRTETGLGAPVKRPGYTQNFVRELIRHTGKKFEVPE
jgi:hypothetical protein